MADRRCWITKPNSVRAWTIEAEKLLEFEVCTLCVSNMLDGLDNAENARKASSGAAQVKPLRHGAAIHVLAALLHKNCFHYALHCCTKLNPLCSTLA